MSIGTSDAIGLWVPLDEPGQTDVVNEARRMKWLYGLRWSNIDDNRILRRTRSRTGEPVELDLGKCSLVLEELKRLSASDTDGPVIISETTGRPYFTHQFRRVWREVADAAGLRGP